MINQLDILRKTAMEANHIEVAVKLYNRMLSAPRGEEVSQELAYAYGTERRAIFSLSVSMQLFPGILDKDSIRMVVRVHCPNGISWGSAYPLWVPEMHAWNDNNISDWRNAAEPLIAGGIQAVTDPLCAEYELRKIATAIHLTGEAFGLPNAMDALPA